MWVFLSSFKFILQNILILYFHIFQGGFEGLNENLKLLCQSLLLPPLYITICTTVDIFDFLLVVQLLLYDKNVL